MMAKCVVNQIIAGRDGGLLPRYEISKSESGSRDLNPRPPRPHVAGRKGRGRLTPFDNHYITSFLTLSFDALGIFLPDLAIMRNRESVLD